MRLPEAVQLEQVDIHMSTRVHVVPVRVVDLELHDVVGVQLDLSRGSEARHENAHNAHGPVKAPNGDRGVHEVDVARSVGLDVPPGASYKHGNKDPVHDQEELVHAVAEGTVGEEKNQGTNYGSSNAPSVVGLGHLGCVVALQVVALGEGDSVDKDVNVHATGDPSVVDVHGFKGPAGQGQ